ncbi:MFS transporter [Peribacillus cavernae]|uniref:MFS transporter n=1 Tax=Peribacillus cavernae TaxID=1674310 RepID=A0A433HC77_9BACI|nr:MFS transporter [Peribacillus cavernae]MDQ0221063.1 ACS family glucarate transporter-like MFS transporter [Peribacillus cavernae]RUQ25836.1 MFS transporter [Peribacillus cavernae]
MPKLQENVNVATTYENPTRVRWLGGLLILFIGCLAYVDRTVFSVTAIPIMEELNITPVQFGIMLTVFSVGYFIFQIPGAILAERKGSRKIIMYSLIGWSIFTALTGVANAVVMLAIIRFFFGVAEAPLFPGANNFTANWFSKGESGRSNSLMNAGAFSANIFAPPIIVVVVSLIGWRSTYFALGVFGIIIAIIWYKSMRSKPSEHPKVNQAELNIIMEGHFISTEKEPEKLKSQWSQFLKQRSFWMLALGYFATLWTIQFFLYWLPFYLQEALGLTFKAMGFYTSLPWIAIVIAVLTAGALSDNLIKKGFSRFWARNMICVVGLTLSAIALIVSTTAATALGNILWLSLALGMAGFAQTLAWSMSTDLGQKYTSTVSGWINTWGFVAASIVPIVAPVVAQNISWNAVFIMNAAVTVLGIIGYLFTNTDKPLQTKTE